MVFKNTVLRKTVRTKRGGTSRRLGNNCKFKICVKYYFNYEIKDMRWAGHVKGLEREKCIQDVVWKI
jgi:hypothetical protein